jgi:hypothetical protein
MADVFEAALLKHPNARAILGVAPSSDTAKRKMPAGKLQNRGLVQFSNDPTYAFPVGRVPFERSKALGDLGYALHGAPVHIPCNAWIGRISVEQRLCILDRRRSQL